MTRMEVKKGNGTVWEWEFSVGFDTRIFNSVLVVINMSVKCESGARLSRWLHVWVDLPTNCDHELLNKGRFCAMVKQCLAQVSLNADSIESMRVGSIPAEWADESFLLHMLSALLSSAVMRTELERIPSSARVFISHRWHKGNTEFGWKEIVATSVFDEQRSSETVNKS